MKLLRFCASLILCGCSAVAADTIEAFGHKWTVPAASEWKVDAAENAPLLRLVLARDQQQPRRPVQFALAETQPYSRVTLEADVRPLGTSLILVFAYRDAAHFNYAHLSTDTGAAQPHHNGIFHVYGGDRVRISSERGPAAFSASGKWYHVALTHDSSTGIVGVTVDGKAVPALDAVDLSLGAGRVGLGSFTETADFRNVKITGTPASEVAPPK